VTRTNVVGDVATVVDCEHRTAPRAGADAYAFSVGTRDVRNGRVNLHRAKPVSRETFESWTRRAVPRPGDLIVSREAPMGEVGAVPADARICLGQRTVLLRLDDDHIDDRFLKYSIMTPATQAWISANSAGSTVLHLNVADVRRIPLPYLPDLAQQRRIVELLEDHLSRLDAADTYLVVAMKRVWALRASALADAFTGERVSLGDLAVKSGYGTSEKCVVGGPGPAVVRIPNLVDGSVNLTDEKRVAASSADVSGSMLEPGDVLIVRTNGSVELIGRAAVVQPGVNAAFASYLIRYRVDLERVHPEWVQAMLSAPQSRALLERLAASSAGQHNLSLGKLNGVPIPLPPPDEQTRRLQRLASVTEELSRLAEASQAAAARSSSLRRALLAAAFSGRLTGSAPDLSVAEEMIGA